MGITSSWTEHGTVGRYNAQSIDPKSGGNTKTSTIKGNHHQRQQQTTSSLTLALQLAPGQEVGGLNFPSTNCRVCSQPHLGHAKLALSTIAEMPDTRTTLPTTVTNFPTDVTEIDEDNR